MNTLKYLGLFLLLTIIGFLVRDYFFDFSYSQLSKENVRMVNRNISGHFYTHLLFAISIGIIPLLYLTIKKITKLNFMSDGLVSCGVIVVCGILLWQFRMLQLNSKYANLPELVTKKGIKFEMNTAELYFERYLFLGFIIGTIISILIFKNKNKAETE